MSKEETIRARVSPEMHAALEAIAAERGESMSIILREAVRVYLAHQKAVGSASDKANDAAVAAAEVVVPQARKRAKRS